VGSPNFLFGQLWVAQGADLFEKHGVTVNIANPNAGATGASALVAGQADVLVTGIGSAMGIIKQGFPAKFVYGMANFDWRAHTMIARQGIKTIADLKALAPNCTVAGATPGTGTYGLQQYVTKNLGLTGCKVLQFASLPDILSAVVSGSADFGLVPPGNAATVADKVSILFDPTKATDAEGKAFFPDNVVSTGVFVSPATLEGKAEELQRFLAALSEADELIKTEKAADLATTVIKVKDAFGTVDPKVLTAQIELQKPIFIDGDVTLEQWNAQLAAFASYGAQTVDPKSPNQSYSAVVDLDPLKASRK
jgi:ABC-type nitrate/sulfonate/bicarbonate transport system substrate-binding protein